MAASTYVLSRHFPCVISKELMAESFVFQKNSFLFIFDCFMKHDSLLCHCNRLKLLLADILPILPYSRYISLIGLAAIICGRKPFSN